MVVLNRKKRNFLNCAPRKVKAESYRKFLKDKFTRLLLGKNNLRKIFVSVAQKNNSLRKPSS